MENDIVLSFHNSLLRKSDVDLLLGPHWLNDQIISFYLQYLENVTYKDDKSLLFMSPEVTQCLKFVSRDEMSIFFEPLNAEQATFIFFPLNDNEDVSVGGSHWSLIVFSRPEKKFFNFDSASNSNLKSSQRFVNAIKSVLNASDAQLINQSRANCLQQANGYDCGIHVLCNIEKIAKHADKFDSVYGVGKLEVTEVEAKRLEIYNLIIKLNDSNTNCDL